MRATCSIPECERAHQGLGLCQAHYMQQYAGRPFGPVGVNRRCDDRDESGRKYCRTCSQWRPVEDFASSSGKIDGLQSRCRECNARIYRKRAGVVRDKNREARFGLTREAFDALLESQGGRCAICRTDNPGYHHWAVDHDHACCPTIKTCGRCIRGILCAQCNAGIGQFRDNPEVMAEAIAYLKTTRHSRAAVTAGVAS